MKGLLTRLFCIRATDRMTFVMRFCLFLDHQINTKASLTLERDVKSFYFKTPVHHIADIGEAG